MAEVVLGMDTATTLDLRRCADAKAHNPSTLTVVSIISSVASESDRRFKLRQTDFRDARLRDARTMFRRPSMTSLMGTTRTRSRNDTRPVCVQSLFVISPWAEESDKNRIVRRDKWEQIIAESEEHQDILIAPTMIDSRTRARELMYVLEWFQQRTPWADYLLSAHTRVHIQWSRMIELFPPPVTRARQGHALWHLASSDLNLDSIFFKHARTGTWQQCADVSVSAFSRDLVRQMTTIPFSAQILHAWHHPFRMHRARCKLGIFVRVIVCVTC